MRKAAFVVAGLAAVAIVIAGCGSKTASLPSSVATVDGTKISSERYYQALSLSFGRQILKPLLEEQVLLNWAKKENVPVTDEQIDKQIEALKRDGNYDDQVKALGGEQMVKDSIRAIQARCNLAKKFTKTTDTELEQVYNSPTVHSRYVHGPRTQVQLIINTNSAEIDAAEKELKSGTGFDEVAAKHNDKQFSMSGPIKLWVFKDQPVLPADIYKAAESLKVGEYSKPFLFSLPQSPTMHAVLKVLATGPKSDLKFKDVKDELANTVALQKAQMDPSFEKKFEEQKKNANITVDIPQLKDVVQDFKNPTPPMMGMPMMAPNVKPGKAPATAAKPAKP